MAHVAVDGPQASVRIAVALSSGAAVAVGMGAYGRIHDPTREAIFTLFFSGMVNLKVWFATVAVALALFQLLSALRMYGKIQVPKAVPGWLGDAHRLSGTLAFLFSLPVAYHCLWALGFQSTDTRVLLHSLAGCFFYGAIVAKVVVVRSHNLPGWALPAIGGATFTALVAVWLLSSVWWWQNNTFPGI